jgi:hypothetical protein
MMFITGVLISKLTGEKIIAGRILVGKYEGKKSLVRPSSRWEGSVKMRLTETELDECGSG